MSRSMSQPSRPVPVAPGTTPWPSRAASPGATTSGWRWSHATVTSYVPSDPLIEDLDQKSTELSRLHRSPRDHLPFLETALVLALHNRYELDVRKPELIPEEPVDLQRVAGVFRIDRTEDVALHFVFLEQPGGPHDPVESSPACFVFAVEVMKFPWTIHAESDEEVILAEEPAPLVVKQDAVGLEGVFDVGPWFLVLFLELDGMPEKIESHKRGLASLPGNGNPGSPMEFQELADIGLVDLRRHPEIASRVEALLLQEKTVAAT